MSLAPEYSAVPYRVRSRTIRSRSLLTFTSDAARSAFCSAGVCVARRRGVAAALSSDSLPCTPVAPPGVTSPVARGSKKRLPGKEIPCTAGQDLSLPDMEGRRDVEVALQALLSVIMRSR